MCDPAVGGMGLLCNPKVKKAIKVHLSIANFYNMLFFHPLTVYYVRVVGTHS